jgi:hypothetical protein
MPKVRNHGGLPRSITATSALSKLQDTLLLLSWSGTTRVCHRLKLTGCITGLEHADGACPIPRESGYRRVRTWLWLKSHTRRCPQCHERIQKNGGCNHMTCRCGYEMCWCCGKAYVKVVRHQTVYRLSLLILRSEFRMVVEVTDKSCFRVQESSR